MDFLSPKLQGLFKKYVELDTSLPSGEHYPEAISLLDDFIQTCEFKTEQIQIPEEVASGKNRVHLVARRFIDNSLPTLLIYNHVDVVPAEYARAFTFKVDDDLVYGRGTSDHKGSTVGVLAVLAAIKDLRPRFNMIFWATCDEETDQLDQLRWMKDKLRLPNNTIVFDPDTFGGGITIGNLGLLQLDILIKGKSAHSGMSNMGINAVEMTSMLIGDFFANKKRVFEACESKIPTYKFMGDIKVCSRCNVNKINGGIAANIVPDSCAITVDCRFIPEANVEEERKKLLDELKDYCEGKHIEYEILRIQEILGHAENHELADELNEIYTKISGEGGLYCAMGSTPLAHFTKELGLPHFGLGVARAESNIHGLYEHMEIKDLKILIEVMKKFLVN